MTYPLGSSPAELDRLRRQHEIWDPATEAVLKLAGFGPGQTLVDLGCGPGLTTVDLARLVGERGRVVGIDASEAATTVARDEATRHGLSNIRIVAANAGDVDLSADQPDGVFSRWLFCYLSDPARVVQRIAAGLRPGGVVAVIDYWHYLAIRTEPRSSLFDAVFRAVYKSFADAGGSLDVGADLPRHFAAAGLSTRHVEPIAAIGRPGSPVWAWISDFQALYLPTLVARGYVTRAEADEYLAWWSSLEHSETAFVCAPPMLAVVGVKK
jgi:ubiquinone/menaquinone biosynthesis C-methylase UbiE